MKRLLVLVSAFLYSICAHSYESLHEIQTTRGESLKYLFLEGQGDVLANVVLFPGGHGRIKASEDGPKGLNGNFLIRTRDQMAAQGFNVISVDAPSDKQQSGKLGGMFQSGFRRSTEHASDIKDLIKKIKEENSLPIWLVGTSRGTESVTNFAVRNSDQIQGIVLTSSIVESNRMGWGLAEYDLEEIKVPTLFVHHEKDGCSKTQASGIPRIAKKLSHAPLVEVKIVTGGKKGKPKKVCGGKSHHGYLGIEDEVIGIMASFIKTH